MEAPGLDLWLSRPCFFLQQNISQIVWRGEKETIFETAKMLMIVLMKRIPIELISCY